MGTRIHVGIGYGLIMSPSQQIQMERFDHSEDSRDLTTTEEIMQDIRVSMAEDRSSDAIFFGEKYQSKAIENDSKPFHIRSCYEYQEEMFGPEKLVLYPYPFGPGKWHRWDDDIDYQMSQIFEKDFDADMTESMWRESQRSFYPYEGKLILDENEPKGYRKADYVETIVGDRKGLKMIPFIPEHLRYFLKHLLRIDGTELEETFLRLRPVFYRWWG